ncbi:uncharacterized, partial [Tachysurus ichikawai]
MRTALRARPDAGATSPAHRDPVRPPPMEMVLASLAPSQLRV